MNFFLSISRCAETLTVIRDLLVALEGMHNARAGSAEGESVDPVGEVVIAIGHERGDVYVAARQGQRFPSGYVEIARYLVHVQTTVNATGVRRVVGFVGARKCKCEKNAL